MKRRVSAITCTLLAMVGFSPLALSQEGRGIGGGFNAEPSLQIDGYFNDNFYRQARSREAVYGAILRPSGRVLSDRGRLKLSLDAGATVGFFDSPSDNDNYFDGTAGTGVQWALDSRQRMTFAYKHVREHDPFGTERTESRPDSIDRDLDLWHSDSLSAGYIYGTENAPINIGFSVNAQQKHYDTNEAVTSPLNHSTLSAQSEVFFNFSPRTAAILEASAGRIYFNSPNAVARSRNGTFKYLLTGLRWKATAQTTGDVRVGYLVRNFDDAPGNRFQALNWRASLTWTPLVLTTIKLSTGRTAQSSYNTARFIDNRYTALDVNQRLSDRLNAGLRGSYIRSNFIGLARNDDLYAAGISAEYLLSQALSLVASATYDIRESDFPVIVTPTNIFDLNFNATTALIGLRYTP